MNDDTEPPTVCDDCLCPFPAADLVVTSYGFALCGGCLSVEQRKEHLALHGCVHCGTRLATLDDASGNRSCAECVEQCRICNLRVGPVRGTGFQIRICDACFGQPETLRAQLTPECLDSIGVGRAA